GAGGTANGSASLTVNAQSSGGGSGGSGGTTTGGKGGGGSFDLVTLFGLVTLLLGSRCLSRVRWASARLMAVALLFAFAAAPSPYVQASDNPNAMAVDQASAGDGTVTIDSLTRYVLPDQTASVMLPDGWHVTRTGIAFIRAEGPGGQLGFFGLVVPAHNAN